MAGLVGYASSDDEDDTSQHGPSPKMSTNEDTKMKDTINESLTGAPTSNLQSVKSPKSNEQLQPQAGPHEQPQPQPQPQLQLQPQPQPTIGPALGPSLPSESNLQTLPEPPSSPYSSNRALIHDLTLPSIPHLDIPQSPPGSPPPSTTTKFQQFLTLKRQGTHFNSKLEQSSALRNPSVTDKLLSFVDLTGPAAYESTLPLELYDPSGFPEWSYREKLRKAREGVVKEREGKAGSRTAVEFVAGSTNSPGSSNTGGASLRGEKRKSGWK